MHLLLEWAAMSESTIRAQVGNSSSLSSCDEEKEMATELTTSNTLYAAGAEPQLHSCTTDKSSKSFTCGELKHARSFTSE